MGHVPDGVYSAVGNVLEVLQAPEHSRDELLGIAEIFRRARERKATADEVAATIRKEAPKFARLAELIPKTPSDLAVYLTAGLTAASLMLDVARSSAPTVTVNQVINQITIQAPATPRATPKTKKTPGSKYKKDKRRLKKGARQTRRGQ